ncbi:pantoate--beta-alanine ligase [Solicola gregarius]|uniref:Pantothenate synthetase n=1 Tax=Solicola gregarius TaxID=2908642 RepID=A0AA46TKG5_9ACTN|nr:pantoate--beta-alanine ligase [Solicola gregarius]UYM06984.1 pantoate--beta-alanine ligase [Solicola gregarius]
MPARVAYTPDELDTALADARAHGRRIAFVPTMGAIHDGHLGLVETAREHGDLIVASVFVNPTQFGPGEDYERYPRDLGRDVELLGGAGVDIVFAPDVETVYPPGTEDVTVDPGPLGQVLEGVSRPTHFRGVLTVVAKLFAFVRPGAAVFGEKDYQQLVLVRRLARALHTGVDVVGRPIVRDGDGLAKSSRNAFLSDAERATALVLSRALHTGAAARSRGAEAVTAAARGVLAGADGVHLDYLALTDAELGEPAGGRAARLLVAARVGSTRLIDNLGFDLPDDPGTTPR